MNETVERRVIPALASLADRIGREGRAMQVAGKPGFNPDDKFLPGKIAIGMAYPLLDAPRGSREFSRRLADYRRIAALTAGDVNETWGIYYYLLALYKLKQAGLLDRAVSSETLAILRQKLDWRSFVRQPDLTLIDLPNNFYGVAFSAARLRFLLGWEDEAGAKALLAKTLDHYRTYSGEYGFADETNGDGRFDRYSVLLIGEIAQRFIETGLTPPAEVKRWLRRSVDLLIPRMNLSGAGFEYGRSIGAYGDTAPLEVLSVAAYLTLLTPLEEQMAYAYGARISARLMDFWYDPGMRSANLWRGGRATDTYRGEHRVLGENLSLFRQLIYTNALWNQLGYRGRQAAPGFARWLATLPRATTTWFARGAYDRALVTIRDGDHVIGLPLISGAEGYHRKNAYFPAPFSIGMLDATPDQTWPSLVPRIIFADGTPLMPLTFFKDIAVKTVGATTIVTLRQDALDDVSGEAPRADKRARVTTRFVFTPGRLVREDYIQQDRPGTVEVEFGTRSVRPVISDGTVRFGQGTVRSFKADGYGSCTVRPVADDAAYHSVTGAMQTAVRCSRKGAAGRYTLRWQVDYR
ncbi:hypothetical protein [Sphingomonas spermidinifaciens]|nr:hypothetical protein [Sphingomonas spermidinifaciens]